ncbi:LPD1 domain-containing protein [uncultured Lactobacillus sp.]|uniref:LPD1 domain-containing protein n=1 Tax=uncultured Lactobacillus sp. TaxID=153152 RepID=UPI0023CE0426|nr:LPD1 domain-containing protein [uncultured Lactobacillus sp.]MDE7056140.1 hypothetical protein [Lactobacillus sp.]
MRHYEQLNIFEFINKENENSRNIKNTNFGVRKIKSNQLSSLMKQKYGVSKISKIRIGNDDDLYTIFKKIAKYIYKNGEWTADNLMSAANTLFPFLGFAKIGKSKHPILNRPSKSSSFMNKEKVKTLKLDKTKKATYNYVLRFSPTSKNERKHYLVITDDYAMGTRCTDIYYYPSNKSYDFTYISAPLLIGYSKLIGDIIECFKNKDENQISEFDLALLLKGLISGRNTGAYLNYQSTYEKYRHRIPIENIKHYAEMAKGRVELIRVLGSDTACEFIDKYLQQTYNLLLMNERESNIITLTHARAWEDKKNITSKIMRVACTTVLRQKFNSIEIDNDVDLSKFGHFEKEVMKVMNWLPRTNNRTTLRLRKIANHHALGLYVPNVNSIVLDFRDSKDNHNLNRAGISSFIHEYGHYLDYQYRVGNQPNILPLSLQDDFLEIIKQVTANIGKLPDNSYVKQKHDYYATPTEIFARAFELYLDFLNVETPLLIDRQASKELDEYKVVIDGNSERIIQYFEKIFPNLRKAYYNSMQMIAADR